MSLLIAIVQLLWAYEGLLKIEHVLRVGKPRHDNGKMQSEQTPQALQNAPSHLGLAFVPPLYA